MISLFSAFIFFTQLYEFMRDNLSTVPQDIELCYLMYSDYLIFMSMEFYCILVLIHVLYNLARLICLVALTKLAYVDCHSCNYLMQLQNIACMRPIVDLGKLGVFESCRCNKSFQHQQGSQNVPWSTLDSSQYTQHIGIILGHYSFIGKDSTLGFLLFFHLFFLPQLVNHIITLGSDQTLENQPILESPVPMVRQP